MSDSRPLIAFVGSVNAEREYRPALREVGKAAEACQEIGTELAKAGCDLLLFSSKAHYVEAMVFRGYANAGVAGRVIVRPPQHAVVEFETPPGSSIEVRVEHDPSGEWELPYYRSIQDSDGLVIVGGGQSSRIAGLLALLNQVPVLPVASFGGGAAQVRANQHVHRNDATDDDLQLLGRPWTTGLGAELVAALLAQRERRRQRLDEQARELTRGRWANRLALIISALALVACWLAFPFAGTGSAGSTRGLLFVTIVPMLAAAAGALLRNAHRRGPWGWSALSGLASGFVTVFLYLLGQVASVPDLFDRMNAQRLLLFLAPLGFISGFTFDRVLERVLKGQTKVPQAADLPPV